MLCNFTASVCYYFVCFLLFRLFIPSRSLLLQNQILSLYQCFLDLIRTLILFQFHWPSSLRPGERPHNLRYLAIPMLLRLQSKQFDTVMFPELILFFKLLLQWLFLITLCLVGRLLLFLMFVPLVFIRALFLVVVVGAREQWLYWCVTRKFGSCLFGWITCQIWPHHTLQRRRYSRMTQFHTIVRGEERRAGSIEVVGVHLFVCFCVEVWRRHEFKAIVHTPAVQVLMEFFLFALSVAVKATVVQTRIWRDVVSKQ
mmetsp:Transcript_20632/g.32851  ORF Transcript_20632/g.32851 Transcript_20632/m.32851 type:complete len:256 (+) Transcript_20632:315-1082(+)